MIRKTSMTTSSKIITIYTVPVGANRTKIGMTAIENDSRYAEYYRSNPDLKENDIHKRPFWNDPKLFIRPANNNKLSRRTYLITSVEGKKLQPDEFLIKMLKLMGYRSPVKEDKKGVHEDSEVFIGLDEVAVDKCLTIAIKTGWNWEQCRKQLVSNKPPLQLYVWQAWHDAQRRDLRQILNSEQTLAEYSCPRFGKTTRELYGFLNSEYDTAILVQYVLSSATSFFKEMDAWSDFADIEKYDLTDPTSSISDLPTTFLIGKKRFISISLCGTKERKKFEDFCSYIKQYCTPGKTVVLMDEVDFGSTTDSSQEKLNRIRNAIPGVHINMFSGTGEDKVNFRLDLSDRVRASAIRRSYVELLCLATGNHYLFSPEYSKSLDPEKNKHELTFIDAISLGKYKNPDCLIKPVFVELSLGTDVLDKVNAVLTDSGENNYNLGLSYRKLMKYPQKYSAVHLNIWKQFLGLGSIAGGRIDYHQFTGKDLAVLIGWFTGTKKSLHELSDILSKDADISKAFLVVPVCGALDKKWGAFTKGRGAATNNKKAEKFANNWIEKAKVQGKGVLFLAMTIAQRSFSVPEIEAVVFYRDSLPADSAEQKLSRVLTPGSICDGTTKKLGYVFDLSLTPNNSIVQNYVFSEINEQARNGISSREAATKLFGVIDVFRLNAIGLKEKVTEFSDTDFHSYVKATRTMWARSEIRELVMSEGDLTVFLELMEFLSKKQKKNSGARDVLDDFVKGAKADDSKRSNRKKNGDDENESGSLADENKTESALGLLRTFLYENVLNMAAIYCYINKIELADIVTRKIPYEAILNFIASSKDATSILQRHMGVASYDRAVLILEQLIRGSLNPAMKDKLNDNLHSSIIETAFEKEWKNDSDINDYLFIDPNNGKIHTPYKTAIGIVSKLYGIVRNDKRNIIDLTYLDPHCKTGTFLRCIHKMLIRQGLSEENIQKQVMGVENDEVYIIISKHISGIKNIVYNNLINDESRRIFIKEYMKRFDVIIGNPPYNAPRINKKGTEENGGKTLWEDFVKLSLELLNEGGYLAYIHTPRWRKPEDNMWPFMTSYQIHFLQILGEKETKSIFPSVSTRVDWYIIQKLKYNKSTVVIDELKEEHIINLQNRNFLPNYMFEEIDYITSNNDDEKCKIIYDRSAYPEYEKRWMNTKKVDNFSKPVIHSIDSTGPVIIYSKKDRGHFGISKLILNSGRNVYPIEDGGGKYGCGRAIFALELPAKDIPKAKKALESEKFKNIIKATKWSNFATDYKFFKYLKKDFWKQFIDENGNEI